MSLPDNQFTVCGENASSLMETFVNDLRMLGERQELGVTPERHKYVRPRRTVVIIQYASGQIAVMEGFNIDKVPVEQLTLEKSSG